MDDARQSDLEAHGSLILTRLIVFSVPVFLILIISILSVLNLVKILSYNKSDGVIAHVTTSSTQGKTPATFYDYAASFETAEKHKIYANVGKTVFIEAYAKGDAVTVYYDPVNPFVAFVNHPATMWFAPIFLAAVTVIWLIAGVIWIRRGRRRR